MNIPANKRPEFMEAFIPGVTGAAAAIVLWPVSYNAAASTAWLSVGAFLDFWLGGLAIIAAVGAIAATITAVVSLSIASFVLAK